MAKNTPSGFTEFLKVLASAWSAACILLFILFFCEGGNLPKEYDEALNKAITVTFFLAITGGGWLSYRSQEKNNDDLEDEDDD